MVKLDVTYIVSWKILIKYVQSLLIVSQVSILSFSFISGIEILYFCGAELFIHGSPGSFLFIKGKVICS